MLMPKEGFNELGKPVGQTANTTSNNNNNNTTSHRTNNNNNPSNKQENDKDEIEIINWPSPPPPPIVNIPKKAPPASAPTLTERLTRILGNPSDEPETLYDLLLRQERTIERNNLAANNGSNETDVHKLFASWLKSQQKKDEFEDAETKNPSVKGFN